MIAQHLLERDYGPSLLKSSLSGVHVVTSCGLIGDHMVVLTTDAVNCHNCRRTTFFKRQKVNDKQSDEET